MNLYCCKSGVAQYKLSLDTPEKWEHYCGVLQSLGKFCIFPLCHCSTEIQQSECN